MNLRKNTRKNHEESIFQRMAKEESIVHPQAPSLLSLWSTWCSAGGHPSAPNRNPRIGELSPHLHTHTHPLSNEKNKKEHQILWEIAWWLCMPTRTRLDLSLVTEIFWHKACIGMTHQNRLEWCLWLPGCLGSHSSRSWACAGWDVGHLDLDGL